MAHFDHLIWPTWVVILCIISPGLVYRVLRDGDIDARRSRGGGNVVIAAAISKGWGEGWENSFIVFPCFPQPVISTASCLAFDLPTQRRLLLSSVRRKRKDSVPVSMMWARSVIRSSKALQSLGFGNTAVHSEKGKLVVTMMAARSARSEIT